MKKVISAILLIVLSIGMYLFFYKDTVDDVKAINGFMNLTNYNFMQNKIVKLDGQWEAYDNKLLSPEDLEHESPDKYLTIPSKVNTQFNGKTMGYLIIVYTFEYLH